MIQRKLENRSRFIRLVRFVAPLILIALMASTPSSAVPDGERISVLAADCVTPRAVFTLGDQLCAIATGAPLEPAPPRRFEWIAPNGTIFQLGPTVDSDPDSNSITLPVAGSFAQPGTWMVKTVDVSNNGIAVAQFLVQDLNKAAADLSVSMFAPFQVSAGTNITFTLLIKNHGPNQAQNVQVKIGAASNATLLSAEQTTGLPFTWQVEPQVANGNGVSAIETFPVNAEAAFIFVYHIGPGTPNGASVSSTAVISSSSHELNPTDNVATAASILALQPCALACPAPIVTQKQLGQCGAIARFAGPAQTGANCGALVCNPASGSFFPLGTTAVICVGDSGSPCSFTVTVDDPQPAAVTCPPDTTVAEDSPGMGLAVIRYKSPVGNDNCAADASACSPPSGSSFPVGATTVTCEISNAWGASATCSFSVTVESSNCSLICPSGIAASNKRNECGAAVNYPAPKTDGNCGSVKCTPPSGSVFPIGETAVSCITSSGSSSTFAVTIQDTQAPVITGISANPSSLLLLNGKMRDVTIEYLAGDNCSGELTCTLSVSSSETGQKGSPPNWEIVDAHHVRLRAERFDKSNDRTYTITITCRDAGGNASTEAVKVIAPGDRR